MKTAIYIGNDRLEDDPGLNALTDTLSGGGAEVVTLSDDAPLPEDADMLLSIGGDGTFLSAAKYLAGRPIPVMGVNFGRMGFLSENRPCDVAQAILSGEYTVENRAMLKAEILDHGTGDGSGIGAWPYALNEFTVHRSGAAMLGVDVTIDGVCLPTYWADGLIVSTSSGSTAYSLSAGGPIVLPESKVLIISPIAPHNLNVRPLVVPDSAEISLRLNSRDDKVILTADNRTSLVSSETQIRISVAQFSLKRVRLKRSNFIDALTEKLFWGEDVRNNR
ncbi:MAG: hypothetical protein E7112_06680 [Bacteroidales bacterium]|nr:hypothetical protein [Bacteroidales bacterium]